MVPECELFIIERCTKYLLEVGLAANLQGFRYLRDAIIYIVKDKSLKRNLNKALYPLVAKDFDVNISVVERAMRHAIDVASAKGGMDGLGRIFNCYTFNYGYQPSVGELISLIGEKLTLEANEYIIDTLK